MQDGISFGSLDHAGGDRFQRLRAELGVETFGLNLIRLAPRQRGRIHAHERQEEVYVVLSGTLTLATADGEHELGPNQAARVAPGVRRQLVNRGTRALRPARDGRRGGSTTGATGSPSTSGTPRRDARRRRCRCRRICRSDPGSGT